MVLAQVRREVRAHAAQHVGRARRRQRQRRHRRARQLAQHARAPAPRRAAQRRRRLRQPLRGLYVLIEILKFPTVYETSWKCVIF